ncbi:MAG: hypothetical protein KAT16_09095, partial [Candidatus Heimdallarchaeota archaeon]|nr:hypothetical protein [Candidatus Heimdallarchaeota archaeon]
GLIVDSTPFNGLIRVTGWNTTQEVGIPTSGSLTSGSYSLSYQIPQNYANNTIFIRSKVIWNASLVHYRPGFDQIEVNVYNDFNVIDPDIDIYLSANSTSTSLVNGSIYYIRGFSHQQVLLFGNLTDQANRTLQDKDVISYWNAIPQTQSTSIIDGSFSFTHDFAGYSNVTWVWEFYHTLDNGTTLSKFFTVSFIWEVYDETKPSITIDSPISIASIALPQTPSTTISTTVIDPSPPSAVSVGLNASSVLITIKLNSDIIIQDSMTNISNVFTFNWDTSAVGDDRYFISIIALDFAGNLQNNSFYAVFDTVEPFATITTTTKDGTDYAIIDSNGDIQISGTLSDSSSTTGRNSGIDQTSIVIDIQPKGGPATLTLDEVSVTVNQVSFSYNWNVFNVITEERNSLFTGKGEDWEIIVTISDNTGNTNQTRLDLKLEEENPIINVKADPPPFIPEGSFTFSVNVSDALTGVNNQSVRFFINTVEDSSVIATFNYDSNEVDINGIDIDLTLSANMFENGEYYITVIIFDNIGNRGDKRSIDFGIWHITTTIPTTTTTTSLGQPPLNPMDLVQFLLLDIMALVGGIGIAVLFEKVKARRKL